MIKSYSRRGVFGRLAGSLALLAASSVNARTASVAAIGSGSSQSLHHLTLRLSQIPRKRQFESVSFMLTDTTTWDQTAATMLLHYDYHAKQVWENSDIAAAWPNLMREAINAQTFVHRNPEFLAVSATHGLAHLALFSEDAWMRYELANLAGPGFLSNTFIVERDGVSATDDLQDIDGFYGPGNNNIVSLQKRGAVLIACHDSIHAIARKLQQVSGNPWGRADQIAAELTNSLIPGCVLVPSVVGFLIELERAGFGYAKGS